MVATPTPPRAYDMAVLGATGFTGRLACQYLTSTYPELRWLAAGRSESKLASLSASLGLDKENLRVVDCHDEDAVASLVQECTVVANFAGTPFLDKALPTVAACAEHGTHYVDITGEVALHRASYDRYHKQALASKALVVHSCGYDSVPSDLGAFLAVRKLREHFGVGAREIKAFAGASMGGVSGGTLATAIGLATGKFQDQPGIKEAASRGAYSLDPEDAEGGPDTSDFGPVRYDGRMRTWHMPNVMAAVNAPVVRKSSALLRYGDAPGLCIYSEVQAVPSRGKAYAGTLGLGLAGLLLALPPVRWLLFAARLLPRPGEGPSQAVRDGGHFHTFVLGVGEREDAPMVRADVRSGTAGDPGYKATAQMAVESALCLAHQREACAEGGVLTPAAAMGLALVGRLQASGMELTAGVLEPGAAD